MSYYEGNIPGGPWPSTRPGWDGRSNGGTQDFGTRELNRPGSAADDFAAQMKSEDPAAFGSQLDEVDRAVDNLVKSGKMFTPRRDSMPVLGGAQPRIGHQMPPRNYSASGNYEEVFRSQSAANLQNYYANQRFMPRPTETEQMLQAKRRLAAQRERDLRNYHQEQQYNRTLLAEMSGFAGKERVMSPGAMSEEDRRELIARQHRALYGEGSTPVEESFNLNETHTPRASNPPSTAGSVSGGTRGPSPLFDPFGFQNNQDGQVQSFAENTAASIGASPARSRTNTQSSRTSASSPGGSPPRGLGRTSTTPITNPGVAPIGTRPLSQGMSQGPAPGLQKRSTTPLPSPLGYGFHAEDPFNKTQQTQQFQQQHHHHQQQQHFPSQSQQQQQPQHPPSERSASAASNKSANPAQDPSIGWGKVWGGKGLGPVASVWG